VSLNKKHTDADARAYKIYSSAKPRNATPSRTWTNATTEGLYKGVVMGSTRIDADQHLAIYSRVLGREITINNRE
jgi:hypothetical protein